MTRTKTNRGLLQHRARSVLCLAVVLAAGHLTAATPAVGQAFPGKPITMVVPFAAGGPLDIIARALTPQLADKLGQPFVVENIGGAGSTLGTVKVARATADGHTLLLQNLALAASGTLYPQTGLDPAANFTTIGFVANNALVLVGRKSMPPNSLAELAIWMKANRSKISHPGVGTTGYLGTVILGKELGAQIDLVPYRGGGPALQDVVAGHVDMFIGTPLAVIELVKGGTIKGFGVTSKDPIPQLPEVRSLAREISPDLEILFWIALFAPAGTPAPAITRISAALGETLASPPIVQAWQKAGMQAYPREQQSPQAGDAIFRAEVKRWSSLIRDNNITAAD